MSKPVSELTGLLTFTGFPTCLVCQVKVEMGGATPEVMASAPSDDPWSPSDDAPLKDLATEKKDECYITYKKARYRLKHDGKTSQLFYCLKRSSCECNASVKKMKNGGDIKATPHSEECIAKRSGSSWEETCGVENLSAFQASLAVQYAADHTMTASAAYLKIMERCAEKSDVYNGLKKRQVRKPVMKPVELNTCVSPGLPYAPVRTDSGYFLQHKEDISLFRRITQHGGHVPEHQRLLMFTHAIQHRIC